MRSKLTLGERIFTARRRVNASQEEIAAACNTNRQQVSKWERGKAVPDLLEAISLARYTRTPLDFFTEDLVIDLSDQPSRGLSWNADGQLDLFSSDALAADVRAGGALWEFSDRTSVDTLTNAEDEVSSRERQLVA